MQKTLLDRIMSKVEIDIDTGCWNWTGATFTNGYSKLRMGKKWVIGHRLAYAYFTGLEIDPAASIRHRCDNPRCVSPFHLQPGTNYDNVQDRVARNRSARLCGETNPNAALTAGQVLEIRRLIPYLTRKAIADLYQVSPHTISRIALGQAWQHLPAEQPILVLENSHVFTLAETEQTS